MSLRQNIDRLLQRSSAGPLTIAVILALLGLPFAVWLDLRALSEDALRRQANETSKIIDDMRAFYANDVVGRVQQDNSHVVATHNYRSMAGAIPIPATLSIELGRLISARDGGVKYSFLSDLPFLGREARPLDPFEQSALAKLRENPKQAISEVTGSVFNRQVRIATPVLMGAACVACHNSHPDSPKRDWKVGDVRGLQEIEVNQRIEDNVFAFKYLLAYFALAATAGIGFIVQQRRQSGLIRSMNRELSETNDFLASISMKIAKYLPPQIYKGIFSGQKDVTIATERKKLTIFFSDIKDFTATAERLQPEELTALLNEYLTEMSRIALEYGGTVDKFIGDAILVFFGDPETKGVTEDARACLRMALAMQRRLGELNIEWRQRGIDKPFQARMGINTGYCNVGNFGSDDRMDYTIIGAEANLAARLQSIAEPGAIVLSYETYALVSEMVRAKALEPIAMKGISREVVPYAVQSVSADFADDPQVIREQGQGVNLFLDLEALDEGGAERVRKLLEKALSKLEGRKTAGEQFG